MEKFIETFFDESFEREVPVSKLSLEIKHDLSVTNTIHRRKTAYTFLLGGISVAIILIGVAEVSKLLDFTTGLFILTLLQLSWMFVVVDILRIIHTDTLRSRLIYPELYTKDGAIYTKILTHEKMVQEVEASTSEYYRNKLQSEKGEE